MCQLGGAVEVAVLVAVFAGAGSDASPQAFSGGFVAAIGPAPPFRWWELEPYHTALRRSAIDAATHVIPAVEAER